MDKVQAIATTNFYHGRNYRKGEPVPESDAVIGDLEKAGLVSTKAAPEVDNKMAPVPANKGRAR